MQLKRGLGRGLESLIPPPVEKSSEMDRKMRTLPIEQITPNRLQPRTVFDEEKIRELANSIKEQGIIQPLAVSPIREGKYELIAGERRLRASKLAGLTEVPVFIKSVDDEQLLALSLLENIQREDLNPIEESRAYQELVEQFDYTQEEVAQKLGKSRSAVANSLRLLKLPHLIQEDVANERYSSGHARALLSLGSLHDQLKLREKMMHELPTVRDIERMVHEFSNGKKKKAQKKTILSAHMNDLIEKMKQALGTKVKVEQKGNSGKVIIEYYNAQDLDRIFRSIVK
ncbi:MAG: ParB/RepB/Spo0J family partition protein [Deltaproteobacteria bacterium]|jgi:ParB family transcriptional regulator, chromosome partitioning protein|nr:ParB/RepB/Spo0J family partition protein [Deltaproteobacteria bacterium]